MTVLVFAVFSLSFLISPVVYAMSAEQKALFNKNILYYDLACGAESASSSENISLDGETTGPPEAVQKIVWATLIGAGIDQMHAAAVMGNIAHEGLWNPKQTEFAANIPGDESEDPHVVGGYGYGLIGWTPGTRLLDSMREAGITGKPYTAETQAAVILAHIEGKTPSQYTPDVGRRFLATTTIEEATTAYQGTASVKGFENPADPVGSLQKRIDSAKEFLNKFSGTTLDPSLADHLGGSLDLPQIIDKYGLYSATVRKLGSPGTNSSAPPTSVASLMKLVIADVFLSTNPDLSKKITIKNNNLYGGGTPQGTPWDPKVGQSFTLEESLTNMLAKSSNTQTNVIIEEMGGPGKVNQLAQDLKYNSTNIGYFKSSGSSSTGSTAEDLTKAMNSIFMSNGPKDKIAQTALRDSSYNFGLDSIANKWGGHSEFTGNVGLFSVGDEKYIVTLLLEEGWQDEILPESPGTRGTEPSPSVSTIKNATNEILKNLEGEGTKVPGGCACPAESGESVEVEGENDAVKVFNVLSSVSDLGPAAISGIIGNLMRETGGDGYDFDPENSAAFEGIVQWDSGRWGGLEAWAEREGKEPRELETQAEYIWVEMTSGDYGMPETLSGLRAIKDDTPEAASKAAEVFDEWFERSSHGRTERMANAAKFFEEYVQGKGLTGAAPEADGTCVGGSGEASGELIWPVGKENGLSGCWNEYRSYYNGGAGGGHSGIDIAAPRGTEVVAADGGKVELARNYDGGGFGVVVIIKHDELRTLYAHMIDGSVTVKEGDMVDQGQKIGQVNNTGHSYGDHLHFNVQKAAGEQGTSATTTNPLDYLPEDGRSLGGCKKGPSGGPSGYSGATGYDK